MLHSTLSTTKGEYNELYWINGRLAFLLCLGCIINNNNLYSINNTGIKTKSLQYSVRISLVEQPYRKYTHILYTGHQIKG